MIFCADGMRAKPSKQKQSRAPRRTPPLRSTSQPPGRPKAHSKSEVAQGYLPWGGAQRRNERREAREPGAAPSNKSRQTPRARHDPATTVNEPTPGPTEGAQQSEWSRATCPGAARSDATNAAKRGAREQSPRNKRSRGANKNETKPRTKT